MSEREREERVLNSNSSSSRKMGCEHGKSPEFFDRYFGGILFYGVSIEWVLWDEEKGGNLGLSELLIFF